MSERKQDEPTKPQPLHPKHRAMVRAYVAGDSVEKIAHDFGTLKRWVWEVLRKPEAKRLIAKLLDEMDQQVVLSAVYAPWLMVLQGQEVPRSKQSTRKPKDAPFWPGEKAQESGFYERRNERRRRLRAEARKRKQ